MRSFAAAALFLMPFAASAQPAVGEANRVSMKYDASATEVTPAALRGACAVTLRAVRDERLNKESVGSDFKPLLSGEPVPWIRDALGNLKAYGFAVRAAGGASDPAIGFEATLTRAYAWTVPMRINAMVALKVDFVRPSGQRVTTSYRALGSKTNVWGATDEFMTTLNYAVNSVLPQIAADLQKLCAGAG
jgi:hypothetical protein